MGQPPSDLGGCHEKDISVLVTFVMLIGPTGELGASKKNPLMFTTQCFSSEKFNLTPKIKAAIQV